MASYSALPPISVRPFDHCRLDVSFRLHPAAAAAMRSAILFVQCRILEKLALPLGLPPPKEHSAHFKWVSDEKYDWLQVRWIILWATVSMTAALTAEGLSL
jgi:hypothetical protein